MNKVELDSASFTFVQKASCLNHSEDREKLEIECLSDLGIDCNENCFYVLKTAYWSIDSAEDLKILFDRINKALFKKK